MRWKSRGRIVEIIVIGDRYNYRVLKACFIFFFLVTLEDYISQPPLQSGWTTWLASGQWDVSRSNVYHFQSWL